SDFFSTSCADAVERKATSAIKNEMVLFCIRLCWLRSCRPGAPLIAAHLAARHSYLTGWSKAASPRLVSANAHQIWTLAISGTYLGTVIFRFIPPPLMVSF